MATESDDDDDVIVPEAARFSARMSGRYTDRPSASPPSAAPTPDRSSADPAPKLGARSSSGNGCRFAGDGIGRGMTTDNFYSEQKNARPKQPGKLGIMTSVFTTRLRA
jgi:hypothetical protein